MTKLCRITLALISILVIGTYGLSKGDFVWDFSYLESKKIEYVDIETYNGKIDPLLNENADVWLLFFINQPG
mgnify:CR=1 FL=1